MKAKGKKNLFSNFTDEKLIKTRGRLKGLLIVVLTAIVIAFVVLAYLLILHESGKTSVAVIAPLLASPATLLPIILILKSLDDEIKERNLN